MMPRHKPNRSPVKRKSQVALAPEPVDHEERTAELERTVTRLQAQLAATTDTAADLRNARTHFLELFEHTPAAYVVHNDGGFIFDWNQAALRLLEVGERRKFGRSLLQFVLNSDLGKCLEHLRRCALRRRAESVELMLRLTTGRYLPVRLLTQASAPLHSKGPVTFYTLILDLTERRATEADLARTQKNYRQLIDTVEGIVWEADAHTLDVSFVNQYAHRLLGYSQADWSRPGFWLNRIHPSDRDRVAHELLRAVEQRADLRIEYRVLTAERRPLWLHDSISVSEQDGRLKLMGVAIDVTEQRETQDQLRLVQSALEQRVEERTAEMQRTVAELEAFSYSISHDLRAPLRAMMGFTELAVTVGGEKLPPRSRELMERVMVGAQRADRMVQDLLSYSRVSRANFKLEPIDLEKMVHELIQHLPQFQPPRAEVKVQSPLLPVLGHEVLLGQTLANLLSNAAKFVAPGKVPRVRLWTEPVDGQVRLWVQDNGIGIEPQHLGRIFGIFERIHSNEVFEGTGIGLAIVRKAVERMGGSVGVESTPGQGSAFWIQLQAAAPPGPRSKA